MARTGYRSDRQDQFAIRLPDGMRARLRQAAEGNRRSVNAEIIARLESSFDRDAHIADSSDVYAISCMLGHFNAELLRVKAEIEQLKCNRSAERRADT